MAANPNSVTTPGMQKAAGHFEGAIGESRSTLERSRGSIAALSVAWTGEASARFGQALNSWCVEYQNIINELSTMHGVLLANAQVYDRTEAGNNDLARNIQMAILSQ